MSKAWQCIIIAAFVIPTKAHQNQPLGFPINHRNLGTFFVLQINIKLCACRFGGWLA